MKLPLLTASYLFAAFLCSPAHSQTVKCTAPDGKVTYSNVACPDSTQSVKPVDTTGNTIDSSELRAHVKKDKAAATQAEAAERERAAFEAGSRQQAQAQAAAAAKQDAQQAQSDAAAYANCTRDVERQGVTEDVKAELFAACRTAGSAQRQAGMAESSIQECVRNIERTGAYGRERAQQTATCHGADVKPNPVVVFPLPIRPHPYSHPRQPPRLTGCSGNQCSDDTGQRYYKQQGAALLREDGKFCQLAAGNTVRCP